MLKPTVTFRQRRALGQKLSATFDFIEQNYKPLFSSLVVIAGLPALLAGILQGYVQTSALQLIIGRSPKMNLQELMAPVSMGIVLLTMFSYLLATAVVVNYMALYEEKGNTEKITVAMVWEQVKANVLLITWGYVLTICVTLLFTILLIIPGIYMGICIQFFMFAIVFEKLTPQKSLHRSYDLVKREWWGTVLFVIVISILSSLAALIIQLPFIILGIFEYFHVGEDMLALKPVIIFVAMSVSLIVLFAKALVWIGFGFQYFHLIEVENSRNKRFNFPSETEGDS